MSILKKPNEENKYIAAKNFFETLFHGRPAGESKGLKNYWLQKKERKEQAKEHNNKLDEIARFVTKYITSRKSSKG